MSTNKMPHSSSEQVKHSWRQEAIISLAVLLLLAAFLFRYLAFKLVSFDSQAQVFLELLGIFFVLALLLCLLALYRWEILRQDYMSQQDMHEKLMMLEEAVQSMEIGLTITDLTGRILYLNRAEARMHGYAVEELMGRDARIFAPRNLWRTMSADDIEEGHRLARDSFNVRSDGSVFPVHLISTVVRNDKGKPLAIVTSCGDITNRKRYEEELQENQRQLRSLVQHLDVVRERERTQVAREIYHEIGTPLTALKLDLALLEKSAAGSCANELSRIHRMVEYIDNTIDMLRAIAHELRPSLLEEVGLNAAIEAEVEEVLRRAEVRCKLELPDEELELSDDVKKALFRGFKEAVTNSLRHAEPASLEVRLTQDGSYTRLEVLDDGIGYAPAEGTGQHGYGLLAITERARLVGGTIEVKGSPGQGTRLCVSIPLEQEGDEDDQSLDR